MKTIIVILILLAFIEASIWPLNFGLIVILTRAFIRQDQVNLILAFGFGLLLSVLQNLNLGLEALLFVLFVEIVYLWGKTTFSENIWSILPVVGILLAVTEIVSGTMSLPKMIVEVILILPIYLIIRFWEERFIVHKEIKLKM